MRAADAVAERDGLIIQQFPERFQRWRDATHRVIVRVKVVFLGVAAGKGWQMLSARRLTHPRWQIRRGGSCARMPSQRCCVYGENPQRWPLWWPHQDGGRSGR